MDTTNANTVTFEKDETNDWHVTVNGEFAGTLIRSWPQKFSFVHGYVRDRSEACQWEFVPSGEFIGLATPSTCEISDGIPARGAHKQLRKALIDLLTGQAF